MELDHVSLQLDNLLNLDPFPIQTVAIVLCSLKFKFYAEIGECEILDYAD